MPGYTDVRIAFDPLTKRDRGQHPYGLAPYDVPFISPITPTLWMGGCQRGLRLPPNVRHVISLDPYNAYYFQPAGVKSSLIAPMQDELKEPDYDRVLALAGWVANCMDDGVTLVHCQTGLNRSGLIVAAALLFAHETREPRELIRSRRSPACLCNPFFEGFIQDRANDIWNEF